MAEEKPKYEYTLQSYLKNPVGAGAASTPQRQVILDALFAKYRALLKEHRQFKFNVYKVSDSVVIHVMVPSETVEGIAYDVCIEFQDVKSTDSSVLTKKIKIFSNGFSFVYTYAYVFNERELLIDYLRGKLPKEALSQPPKKRNPDETINYEKSIVYAIYFIQEHRLFLKENYGKMLTVSNKLSVKGHMPDFEDLEHKYEYLKKMQNERVAREKKDKKAALAKQLEAKKNTRRIQQQQAAKVRATKRAQKK
jgi:hypothetical protein